jgi:hypothetical protein
MTTQDLSDRRAPVVVPQPAKDATRY